MNRNRFVVALAVAIMGAGALGVRAGTVTSKDIQAGITAAEKEVEVARMAIEKGKQLLATIPEDSPLMDDVVSVVEVSHSTWKSALESLEGARASAAKIEGAPSADVAADYASLARVNADVALAGAKVVQTAVVYVEAVATDNADALDIIRPSLVSAVASSKQVQFNYGQLKSQIAKKYSK